MPRVLFTGATGFIGRHCLPLLEAAGYEIDAVSSSAPPAATTTGTRWHQVDLLDPRHSRALIETVRPTHLLHLAWYAEPLDYRISPRNLQWFKASLDLLQAFAKSGGQRVVIAGTCAEYAPCDEACTEEKTPLAPASLYGASKHALQVMLRAYAQQMSMSAAWGRIFFLYGPHERAERLVASVIRSLLMDQPARCSHGRQRRDFLYVEDVASAFVALLGSAVGGPVNIASGQAPAVGDVVRQIAEKLNRTELLQLGAVPVGPNDPPLILADSARLRQEVGWTPRYDLSQGLDKTIEWWRKSPAGR